MVVDIDVPYPLHGVAGGLQAEGVVLILEHADLIPLIEEAEPLEDVAAQRCAEHRQHPDRYPFPLVRHRLLPGHADKLAIGLVRHVDLCLVAGPVCRRADETETWILQVAGEAGQPAVGDHRVVVEEDEQFPVRRGQRLVVVFGEAESLFIAQRADMRVLPGKGVQVFRSTVGRGIVDDDELVIRVVGVGEDACHTKPEAGQQVGGYNENARQGERRTNGGIDCFPAR
jgi:hypothetical protein